MSEATTVHESLRPLDEEVLRVLAGFAGASINVSAVATSVQISSTDAIAAVDRLREKGLVGIDFPIGYPFATAAGYRWLDGADERTIAFANGLA